MKACDGGPVEDGTLPTPVALEIEPSIEFLRFETGHEIICEVLFPADAVGSAACCRSLLGPKISFVSWRVVSHRNKRPSAIPMATYRLLLGQDAEHEIGTD